MRFRGLLVSTLHLLTLSSTVAAQDVVARMQQYMAARTALGQFSGTVLVARQGKVLLDKGFGFASLEQAVPNTPQTRFAAASLTKQFVAYAVQQLRNSGKLSLTDSICKFVDACPAAWQPVTIDNLIHHSSGVPDYESALDLGSLQYARFMLAPNTADTIVAEAKRKPLDFAPGTKFRYSNTGYILLAKVIEKVSSEKFADYMQAHVFAPLQMSSTGIFTSPRAVRGLAYGYNPLDEVPLTTIVAGLPLLGGPFGMSPTADMTGTHGDGGMYTTAEDLYKWDQALYSPKLAPDTAEMFRLQLASYGFGWMGGTRLGMTEQFHTGSLPGYNSRIERFPGQKMVVILLSNLTSSRLSKISRDLTAIAIDKPYDVPRSHRIIQRDSLTEATFAGSYALPDGRVVEVHPGNRFLEISIKGEFIAGLLPEARNLFYAPLFEGTVKFDAPPGQPPATLTMHYDGEDRVAKRTRS